MPGLLDLFVQSGNGAAGIRLQDVRPDGMDHRCTRGKAQGPGQAQRKPQVFQVGHAHLRRMLEFKP